jgi:aryl-alcohol dehydrogenase-like predicted oxidoreductase
VRQHLANPQGAAVLAALDDIAARHLARPAQVALAWIMAQPGITAPIASATSTAQLEELAGAADLGLDADDLAALDAASTPPSA